MNRVPLLTAHGVTKSFGPQPALQGVDLTIHAGEAVAIMGPSGSGKSTLLHALAGVVGIDGGEVHFHGNRIDNLPDSDRAKLRLDAFGFVFQFGQLIPDVTALENVALPLLLRGISRAEATAQATTYLEMLDVADHGHEVPALLSGGQAQRVAIARAMAGSPGVIFADEPTGALDTLTSEKVMTALMKVVRESGTTLIIVTHDPRTAAFADREIIVRDGRVASDSGGADA
ncbi:ABC transporter ATP-binding protein [Microbacterium sp. NC79]|uniref:ABC transporter ATP-binding protein n=1 Tax=Microbacterium sp. NC79 TaxID=2851009 RepID=UPI001C2BEB7E|nr:ABC transporter ATP-binding protein [Microbacterium sp. NC79]MBV0893997.1 ABC transporter ATP-binding protein [Microbacterium sp. NC79]